MEFNLSYKKKRVCLKYFSWYILSFGDVSHFSKSSFLQFWWEFSPNLSLVILIKRILTKKVCNGAVRWRFDEIPIFGYLRLCSIDNNAMWILNRYCYVRYRPPVNYNLRSIHKLHFLEGRAIHSFFITIVFIKITRLRFGENFYQNRWNPDLLKQ